MSITTAYSDKETAEKYGIFVKEETYTNGDIFYISETYKGCVLYVGEHNFYDDSDFYAIVYNAAENKLEKITYATTRFWTYMNNAQVDATEETIKAVLQLRKAQTSQEAKEFSVQESKKIEVGKMVKVVKGRKIAKGTIGKVMWIKDNPYNGSNPVVSIEVGNTIQRTYMDNLEVLNPEAYTLSEKDTEYLAHRRLMFDRWSHLYTPYL